MKVTLEQIETEQSKVSELISKFKKQLKTTIFEVPASKIELNFGERYAGLILDAQGQPSHHLILLPDREEKDLNWVDAKKWAESVGGELPTRKEQSLLFANLKGEFEKRWHWSSEPEGVTSAWVQYFFDGNQYYFTVSFTSRARAVRRLEIY
jgi:hypothetical protein